MSFAEKWPKATIDGGNSSDPPPEGDYEVLLKGASAFVSKSGNEVVKLELEVVSANEHGHEWTEIRGFSSQQAANAAKATCHRLGVDTDAVSALEELDAALKEKVGAYYAVSVVRKGDWLNTYINEPTGGGIDQVPAPAKPAAAPVAAGFTDEDIPF